MKKQDLYVLNLVDGLKSRIGDKEVIYKTVRLRETTVADEIIAVELSERIMTVQGKTTLIVSDELYRLAMNMRHIEAFSCPGLDDIDTDLLDLKMMGRLSTYDMQKIEERVMLISMAAAVRYGTMSQKEFDNVLAGIGKQTQTKRSEGQAEGMATDDSATQSGPQMLADNSTQHA